MRRYAFFLFLILIPSACAANPSGSKQAEIQEIAWQALEPNTSSHDQSAWDVVELRTVKGVEIKELFAGEPVPGNCVPGPLPAENRKISASRSYWYVQMKPASVAPEPPPTEQYSPTAPPGIPEPFLRDAHFLVDPGSGEIVARKLYCIIY